MKHKILSRALSLTAAAAMVCTAAGGSGSLSIAAAQLRQPDPIPVTEQQTDTLVPVIVKVAGDAVLAHPDAENAGADFLESDLAKQIEAECSAVQQSVQNNIRRLYPELNVSFSYTTLYNGFSCELPADLIEQVRALPNVISAVKADTVEIPQMDRAAALSGFPAYYDMTGCSGEGQVIAVIDSELDVTHPMFAPLADDIETALSREDIAEIAGSGELHVNVDPDRAYISSKLPYVIDYVDDYYDGLHNERNYHGTHVCGIAAGNAFKDSDGKDISGIAKDAQLLFFATSTNGGGIALDASIAALEDAIRLHADVINMSWGAIREYFGENPLSDVLNAADHAGIVVCSSAGNADDGTKSYGKTRTPEALNYGVISDKAELGSPVFLIASADNTGLSEAGTLFFGGEKIVYRPMMNDYGSIIYLSDELKPGNYEYVYCGKGMGSEIRNLDLSDKIMLIDRGYLDFTSMAGLANDSKAVGVIVIDKEYPDGLDYARSVYNDMPLAVITYQEGQMLREAAQKVITITGEKVMRDYPTQVSSYSSWGVKESLDLRPDIMGIGGRVRSAGYASSLETMSGTSMSSPYVTGCVAVIREYLRQQGITLTGSEFSAYIRRLLMNAAIPYEENGNFVTPRRQGAGLVSLDRAVSAKVLMSGETGDAKVNLFDNLGTEFSFPVTLTNNSPEDVTFSDSGLRLTTDAFHFDKDLACNVLYGQQALSSTTDFSGPVTVGAGQSQTVTVHVSLDSAQYASLKETFKYGFFIEGYLMLSGAENSADVSIPVFGFSDDWAQFPIADSKSAGTAVLFGNDAISTGLSLVEANLILKDIKARVSEDELYDYYSNPEAFMTEEEKQLIRYGRNDVWISPNDDSVADAALGVILNINRWSKGTYQLQDADGNVLYEKEIRNTIEPLGTSSYFGLDYTDPAEAYDQTSLKEGEYSVVAKAYVNYPGSAEAPQEYRSTFHVDKTAPEVAYKIVESGARVYLEIWASDNQALQGITVTGIGRGGLKGTYQPDDGEKDGGDNLVWNARWLDCWRGSIGTFLNEDIQSRVSANTRNRLPYVLREMCGLTDYQEGDTFNFQDVIAPTLDETGKLHILYDITDLSHYSFTVLDNAYNYAEIRSIEDSAERLIKENSVWQDYSNGLFEISDGNLTFASYYDGSVKTYSAEAEKETLVLKNSSETRTFTVYLLSDNLYKLIEEDTDTYYTLRPEPSGKHYAELMPTLTVKDAIELAIDDSEAFWNSNPFISENFPLSAAGKRPVLSNYILSNPSTLMINLSYGQNEDDHETTEQYMLSLSNGRGSASYSDPHGIEKGLYFYTRHVDLIENDLTAVPAGLYYSKNTNEYYLFGENTSENRILYSQTYNHMIPFSNGSQDKPFTYTVDEDSTIVISCANQSLTGKLSGGDGPKDLHILLDTKQDNCEANLVYYEYELIFVTDDPEQIASLRSPNELIALASAYEEAVTGIKVESSALDGALSSETNDEPHAGFSWIVDTPDCFYSYAIHFNIFTLIGSDMYGNVIDLLNPPKLSEDAHSLSEIRETAAAYALQRDGIEAEQIEQRIIADNAAMSIVSSENYDNVQIYTFNAYTGFGFDMNGNPITMFQTETYMCGDVNCDGMRDVADAVLLARYLAEDTGAVIAETGKRNSDCNGSGKPDQNDVVLILKAIARLIRF